MNQVTQCQLWLFLWGSPVLPFCPWEPWHQATDRPGLPLSSYREIQLLHLRPPQARWWTADPQTGNMVQSISSVELCVWPSADSRPQSKNDQDCTNPAHQLMNNTECFSFYITEFGGCSWDTAVTNCQNKLADWSFSSQNEHIHLTSSEMQHRDWGELLWCLGNLPSISEFLVLVWILCFWPSFLLSRWMVHVPGTKVRLAPFPALGSIWGVTLCIKDFSVCLFPFLLLCLLYIGHKSLIKKKIVKMTSSPKVLFWSGHFLVTNYYVLFTTSCYLFSY